MSFSSVYFENHTLNHTLNTILYWDSFVPLFSGISDVAFSPDGCWVAYSHSDSQETSSIRVVNIRTRRKENITRGGTCAGPIILYTLYTPFIPYLHLKYTRCTCIYTIYTPKTPLIILYTSFIHPVYTLYTP